MELTVLAVGRLRPAFREACDEYVRRLGRYFTFHEVEVREASRTPTPEVQRREEAAALRKKVAAGALTVCLSRMGEPWSSEELARRLAAWQQGARPVALLVGGSHGLADELMAEAGATWSLGPATFPHELARVIVVEQLYRAATILRGEPYHKARTRR